MKITIEYWKDDGWFVGKIKEHPDVFSQGETLEELKSNLKDAYQLMRREDFPEAEIEVSEIKFDMA